MFIMLMMFVMLMMFIMSMIFIYHLTSGTSHFKNVITELLTFFEEKCLFLK